MDEFSLPNQEESLWQARMSRMDSMINATMMKRQVILARESPVVPTETDNLTVKEPDVVVAEESADPTIQVGEADTAFNILPSFMALGEEEVSHSETDIALDLEDISVSQQDGLAVRLSIPDYSRPRLDENTGYPMRHQEKETRFVSSESRWGFDPGVGLVATEGGDPSEMPVRRRNIDAEPTPLEIFNAMSHRREMTQWREYDEDSAPVVPVARLPERRQIDPVGTVVTATASMRPLAVRTGASDRDAVVRLLASLGQSRGIAQETSSRLDDGAVLSTDDWGGMDSFTVDAATVASALDAQTEPEPEETLVVDLEVCTPEAGQRDTLRRLLDDFRQQRQVMAEEGEVEVPGLILGAERLASPWVGTDVEKDVILSIDIVEDDRGDAGVQEIIGADEGDALTDHDVEEVLETAVDDETGDGVAEEPWITDPAEVSEYEVVEEVLVDYLEQGWVAEEGAAAPVITCEDPLPPDGEEEIFVVEAVAAEPVVTCEDPLPPDGKEEIFVAEAGVLVPEPTEREILDSAVLSEEVQELAPAGGDSPVRSFPETFHVDMYDQELLGADARPVRFTRPPKAVAQVRVLDEWSFVVHTVANWLGRLSEKAVRKYVQVVSLGGSFTRHYHADRGKRFYQLGMFHDAAFHYRKALKNNGHDSAILSALGRCYLKLGDAARALGFLEKARKQAGSGGGWLDEDLIVAYIGTGQYDLALAMIQKSLAGGGLDPSDRAALLFRLAGVLDHQNRSEEAVAAYKEAVALDPGRVEYSRALGYCLQMAGKSQEAAHYLRVADAKEDVEEYPIALE
ncbi:MAG: tetratricopeptide repeat protein [Magnetococcus sp. THC-1_WYH]